MLDSSLTIGIEFSALRAKSFQTDHISKFGFHVPRIYYLSYIIVKNEKPRIVNCPWQKYCYQMCKVLFTLLQVLITIFGGKKILADLICLNINRLSGRLLIAACGKQR
jgi:hypothetical protein